MFSKFIHVIACINISFLFVTKHYSLVWIEYILFIHLQAVTCFHFEAILNDAARNVRVQVLHTHMFLNPLDIQQGVEPPSYLVTPRLAF